MRTPTWDEFREFLKHDDWEDDRATGHDFFERTLPDGEILRTHASRSGSKSMSPGQFKAILSDQLGLSEAEFWDVLQDEGPGRATQSGTCSLPRGRFPCGCLQALEREVGLTREQIAELDERGSPAAGRSQIATERLSLMTEPRYRAVRCVNFVVARNPDPDSRLADLAGALNSGTLVFELAKLAEVPRAALVVEDGHGDL